MTGATNRRYLIEVKQRDRHWHLRRTRNHRTCGKRPSIDARAMVAIDATVYGDVHLAAGTRIGGRQCEDGVSLTPRPDFPTNRAGRTAAHEAAPELRKLQRSILCLLLAVFSVVHQTFHSSAHVADSSSSDIFAAHMIICLKRYYWRNARRSTRAEPKP
jgi:hypothetical protein